MNVHNPRQDAVDGFNNGFQCPSAATIVLKALMRQRLLLCLVHVLVFLSLLQSAPLAASRASRRSLGKQKRVPILAKGNPPNISTLDVALDGRSLRAILSELADAKFARKVPVILKLPRGDDGNSLPCGVQRWTPEYLSSKLPVLDGVKVIIYEKNCWSLLVKFFLQLVLTPFL
eukprot:SAG31_NODE_534_length_14370_cov_121.217434_11_plen_174_part_00